jgi:type IV pilus assembly protein PilO
MAILPQNPRDQRLVIVGLLAIGLAGVYQQLYWTPKQEDLHHLEVRLDTLDSLNRLAKLEVSKGSAAKMKAEADEYARELSILHRLVPTSNEVPPLLESISSAARRAGLEISAVAPDGVVQGDQFDTYRYKIGVVGPYHKVGAFLTNIGSLPRMVAPINLSLTPTTRTGELKPKKDEQFLDASFGVLTYVAHSAPPAPMAAKPGSP